MAKLIGTKPNQAPTNADLGSAAYTDINAMPRVVIGEPQEGIRFVDEADKYALRVNGYDYYSSGIKLSRTGSHGYTGTIQFEKIKTDADGNVVDTKSGDSVMQLYSNGTNSAGDYVGGPSIIAKLDEDIGTGTTSSGRFEFRPDGGSGAAIKCIMDTDGLKFNGDLAAANALDDYEEGTWNPASGVGTATVTGTATYVKIGKMVFIAADVQMPNQTNSNQARIIGLPFTPYQRGSNSEYNISPGEHTYGSYIALALHSSYPAIVFRPNGGTSVSYSTVSAKRFRFSGWYEVA